MAVCKFFGYPVGHHSERCMDDGVGCDGTCETHEIECECACHGNYAPDFITDDDVRKYHDA